MNAADWAHLFLSAYHASREANRELWQGDTFARCRTAVVEQRLAELRTAYDLLPEPLRQRAWLITSVRRAV